MSVGTHPRNPIDTCGDKLCTSLIRAVWFLAVTVTLLTMTGCGTLVSQFVFYPSHGSQKPVIYSGIRMDVSWVADVFKEGGAYPALMPLIILDMPLSAVADTLILPCTVPEQLKRDARKRKLEESHGER